MFNWEVCKALATMGHPQDRKQPFWGSLDGGPFELFYPGNRHFQLYGPYMKTYACPSEVEALDWLEKELGYVWNRISDAWEDRRLSLWHARRGMWTAECSTPSELILAIYEDWKTHATATKAG